MLDCPSTYGMFRNAPKYNIKSRTVPKNDDLRPIQIYPHNHTKEKYNLIIASSTIHMQYSF